MKRFVSIIPTVHWGFHYDDSYFADKKITVSRLNDRTLEDLSVLDASEAVACCRDVGFDNIQMVRDDKDRWALYIKPERQDGFAVYPDKGDINQFFTTLKQSMDNIDAVRIELAKKYYVMAAAKPDLKVELFGPPGNKAEADRIQRVVMFRAKSGAYLCAATIDGKKLQAREVSSSQWQRLWLAPDKDAYKQHLAATLYADILQKERAAEQTIPEKQENSVQKETAEEKDGNSRGEHQAEKQEAQGLDHRPDFPSDKQYNVLKERHPDVFLLFRNGDFYTAYNEDAVKASELLSLTLMHNEGAKKGSISEPVSFPYHCLDTYLPRLIRSGERCAICDPIEEQGQKQEQSQSVKEEDAQQQFGGMKR